MPDTPPLPGQKPPRSVFHWLALASLLVTPAACLLWGILNASGVVKLHPLLAIGASLVTGIMMMAGFLAGLVSLFGISKHGSKGILLPALIGIILPILLTALAVPAIVKAANQAQAMRELSSAGVEPLRGRVPIERQLTAMAAELTSQAPTMVDEETRLDRVEAGPGRTLNYHYTLITTGREDLDLEAFENVLREQLIEQYRDHPGMKPFRDEDVTLVYIYRDKAGDMLSQIQLSPSDLK